MPKYTATKWHTPEEKEKFEKQFKRFVLSGFKSTLFTKAFYQRLSNTFGHIAHYDQGGFYDTFFTTSQGRMEFLRQTARYECYGDPEWTFSDVEKVLRAWVIEEHLVEAAERDYARVTEQAERDMLKRLQAKYPDAARGEGRAA